MLNITQFSGEMAKIVEAEEVYLASLLDGTSSFVPTTTNTTTSTTTTEPPPTATPIARSILSLTATVTAVACSAALPTIGRRINPTKVFEIPPDSVISLIEST